MHQNMDGSGFPRPLLKLDHAHLYAGAEIFWMFISLEVNPKFEETLDIDGETLYMNDFS